MNAREVNKNGKTYVFVTRTRSKVFSDDEIESYFSKDIVNPKCFIPDDRNRKRLFIKDLKMGLHFCCDKYGVSPEEVILEARRLAPHMIVK